MEFTYIAGDEVLVGVDVDHTKVRLDFMTLECRCTVFSLVIYRNNDVCLCEQGQLHRFFEEASFALVEAYLYINRALIVRQKLM